jgi:hypothetical protein
MTFDPKTCREHAEQCAELARQARLPQHQQTLSHLAQSWASLALEIERNSSLTGGGELTPKPH